MTVRPLPNLSARQLQAVCAVARYSSFIAAAADLRMSQPGLSRIVRAVEDELGAVLFDRTTRQVTLTTAGGEFVLIAERILHDLKLGSDAIRSLMDQGRGHVSIACPMSIAHHPLAGIITDYRHKHPNIQLEIREGLQGGTLGDIRSGLADFGVGFVSQPNDDLLIDVLGIGTFHAVFHKDHPFAARAAVSLAELRQESLIGFPPSSNLRKIFDGAAAGEGFRLDYAITVNTYSTLAQLLRNAMGVAILASPALPEDAALRHCPIDPPSYQAHLALMSLRSRPMSPAAQGFKAMIRAYFDAHPVTSTR
jgi:DNA-binding transcriptional LysR family regulator